MAEQTSFEEKMNSEESKTTKMNVQSEETYGSSDLQNQEKKEKAWCWVVCFAAFLIILMRKGFLLSFGLILPDILKEFKQSKAKTGELCYFVTFLIYLTELFLMHSKHNLCFRVSSGAPKRWGQLG